MNTGRFDLLRSNRLQWLPELDIGWYPVTEQPYDAGYFNRYRAMDVTAAGHDLTALRCALVDKYWTGALVDIGIGGGRFAQQHGCKGFDINPCAVDWLKTTGRWQDPYAGPVEAVSFWDSLEHIHDPMPLLANVGRFVFVSLPIFKDAADALKSKHFRRNEHCWYFTHSGMCNFMAWQGFELIEHNTMEQVCREQIGTYVFRRVT